MKSQFKLHNLILPNMSFKKTGSRDFE